MFFLIISFLAGILTVLAPCVLPLLPVIVGSTATAGPTAGEAKRGRHTAYVVIGSLGLSIIAFTFLLKASTAFINIPAAFWDYLSGGIIILFGLSLLFPSLWERLPGLAALARRSNKLVGTGYRRQSWWGDVLIGAALGPVFSSCSPTYFLILATVLPAAWWLGTLYLLIYTLGLALSLLVIAKLGEKLVNRLGWAADPRGWFKKVIGLIFLILGLLIISGWEKKLEAAILSSGFFDITRVEQALLQKWSASNQPAAAPEEIIATSTSSLATSTPTTPAKPKAAAPPKFFTKNEGRYKELVKPDGYLNTTSDFTLGSLVGQKVILLDFWTYSCINCQRTLPYLVSWYAKYHDFGLEIVGIHTPEFAFEHLIENVRQAVIEDGIKYPVVLDNEYATWSAYGNLYWPRKYLINIDGTIVYDHIGEGAYDETEKMIQKALAERAAKLGLPKPDFTKAAGGSVNAKVSSGLTSPEIYFGSARSVPGQVTLGGEWQIRPEYIESTGENTISYGFIGQEVYWVAGSAKGDIKVDVLQDGQLLKTITVNESKLYTLIENQASGPHQLELRVHGAGLQAHTFTFG